MKVKPMATPVRSKDQIIKDIKEQYVIPGSQAVGLISLILVIASVDSIVNHFLSSFGI